MLYKLTVTFDATDDREAWRLAREFAEGTPATLAEVHRSASWWSAVADPALASDGAGGAPAPFPPDPEPDPAPLAAEPDEIPF